MFDERPLAFQTLETPEAIAAETTAWDRLVDDGYDGHPCLRADWFLLWLRHFGAPDVRPCFLKVSRGNKSLAYFPFVLATDRLHGVEVRTLRFAGNIYSPINTPIVRRACRQDLFDHVVREALPRLPWTVFQASDLPLEYTGSAEIHAALCGAGHDSFLLPGEGSWVHASGGASADRYLRGLDAGLRNSIKRWQRRLGGMGRLELRVASEDATEADIAAYQSVYARSWKEPEIDPTFHPALIRWAAERGLLRLFLLTLDGRPIATQLWLVRARRAAAGRVVRAYAVKFAYDEAYRENSAGALLMWRAIEHLLDRDRVELFDFLKGDDPYKKQWCNQRRQRLSILAFSPDLRGRTARLFDRELLPWVRRQPALSAVKRRAAAFLLPRDGRGAAQNFSPAAARITLGDHHDERIGSQG